MAADPRVSVETGTENTDSLRTSNIQSNTNTNTNSTGVKKKTTNSSINIQSGGSSGSGSSGSPRRSPTDAVIGSADPFAPTPATTASVLDPPANWRPDYSAFKDPGPPDPLPLNWVPIPIPLDTDNPQQPTSNKPAAPTSLRIVSWNLLAQSLLRRDHYPTTPKDFLKLAYRMPLAMSYINQLDASILCLQEFDRWDAAHKAVLDSNYQTFLLRKKRVPGSRVEREDGRNGNAGQGILVAIRRDLLEPPKPKPTDSGVPPPTATWKVNRYRPIMLDTEAPNVLLTSNGRTIPCALPLMLTRGTETGNVAQILALTSPEGRKILLANTHLFWRPRSHLARLRQLWVLFRHLANVRSELGWHTCSTDLILCGDLNLKPSDPTYLLLFPLQSQQPTDPIRASQLLWDSHLADTDPGTLPPPRWTCDGLVSYFLSDGKVRSANSTYDFGVHPFPRCLKPSSKQLWSTASGYGQSQWLAQVDYVSSTLSFSSFLEAPDPDGVYLLLRRGREVGTASVRMGMPGEGWPSDHVPVGGEIWL